MRFEEAWLFRKRRTTTLNQCSIAARAVEPQVRILRDYSAVSLIGSGITDRYNFLLDSLTLLRNLKIPIAGLHTSSFRITFLPPRSRMREAAQAFHRHFIEMNPETIDQ